MPRKNKQPAKSQRKDKKQQEDNEPNPSAVYVPPQQTRESPIFFFKDDEQPHGFLCQWYRCSFTDPDTGLKFNCAEQWMMWSKARLANDTASAQAIMATTSPRKQKQLGRDVEGFDPDAWDKIKSAVVEKGNFLKFTQGTNVVSLKMDDVGEPVPLKDLLLATGEHELVEASKFDRVWGIGFDAQQALMVPRGKWGQNLLGEALMRVRERIRREAEATEGTS